MKRYLLGVDNGGSFVKAGLFDYKLKAVALVKEASPALNDGTGRSERDQSALWAANCHVLSSVIAKSGIDPEEIACVTFAGQGKGLYMVDEAGRDLGLAITSADLRARDYAKRWQENGAADRLFPRIYQGIHPYQPAALLAWLRDNEPERYARIRWSLTMKDYLGFRMTGRAVSDYASQSGSPFINFNTLDYDPKIFRTLGIEAAMRTLPPLKWPWAVNATVTEEAAFKTGLRPGTPVSTGMFDVDASMLAMGAIDPECLCMITGTWSINACVSLNPVVDRSVMFNSLYLLPDRFLLEEGSPTSAGVLEWVIDALLPDISREDAYKLVNQALLTVPPENNPAIFLPFVHGFLNSNRVGGVWSDLTACVGRAHMLAAACEGVAFAHRAHVERLLSSRKGAPCRLCLAGGVTHSPAWVQCFADVLGIPLEVVDNGELGVLGAALNSGVAAGLFPDYTRAISACLPARRVIQPNPRRAEIYQEKYLRFLESARAFER